MSASVQTVSSTARRASGTDTRPRRRSIRNSGGAAWPCRRPDDRLDFSRFHSDLRSDPLVALASPEGVEDVTNSYLVPCQDRLAEGEAGVDDDICSVIGPEGQARSVDMRRLPVHELSVTLDHFADHALPVASALPSRILERRFHVDEQVHTIRRDATRCERILIVGDPTDAANRLSQFTGGKAEFTESAKHMSFDHRHERQRCRTGRLRLQAVHERRGTGLAARPSRTIVTISGGVVKTAF